MIAPLSLALVLKKQQKQVSQSALIGVGIIFVVSFTFLELRRFALLGAQAFDLGIFQQGVWLLAHGHTPFVTVRGWHLFADHFSPILFLFVPFYRLWAHPFWLFLGQTLALALGTIPLYRLALRHTQSEWVATFIAFGYLLHPAICTMLFFDFHPILLSVPFVLWAMDALDEGRSLPFFFACLGALLCREDVAISVACLGLYGWIVRKRRWSAGMVVVSVIWFFAATKAMAVLSGEERTAYFSLYAHWGKTPLQILWGIFTHPVDALKSLVLCKGHFTQPGAYPMLILAPFAFYPLFSGWFALFGLPCYGVLALSDWRAMRELGFQHAALIAPWLAASLPLGFRWLLTRVDDELLPQWRKALVVTLGACLFLSFLRYVPHTYRHFYSLNFPEEQAKRVRSFLARVIPPDAIVSAPSQFVPHLAHRQAIYLFPNPFQRAGYGPSATTLKQLDGRLWVRALPVTAFHQRMQAKEVDYIVLKAGRINTWPLKPKDYEQTAIAALSCPDYGVVAVQDDVVVLKRGANFEAGLVKLGVPVWKFVGRRTSNLPATLARAIRQAWASLREVAGWNGESIGHFGKPP